MSTVTAIGVAVLSAITAISTTLYASHTAATSSSNEQTESFLLERRQDAYAKYYSSLVEQNANYVELRDRTNGAANNTIKFTLASNTEFFTRFSAATQKVQSNLVVLYLVGSDKMVDYAQHLESILYDIDRISLAVQNNLNDIPGGYPSIAEAKKAVDSLFFDPTGSDYSIDDFINIARSDLKLSKFSVAPDLSDPSTSDSPKTKASTPP